MKTLSATLLLSITLLITLSLGSCISIQRNIKLNTDGSGSETLNMVMDKEYMLMVASFAASIDSTKKEEIINALYNDSSYIGKVKSKMVDIPGIQLLDVTSVTSPDSSKVITVLYNFNNIELLTRTVLGNEKVAENQNSEVSFKDNGSTVTFLYKLTGQSFTEEKQGGMQSELKELFKDDRLTFNIEMPYDVISTNAAISDGRKLTWEFDLIKMMELKEPILMTAEMSK